MLIENNQDIENKEDIDCQEATSTSTISKVSSLFSSDNVNGIPDVYNEIAHKIAYSLKIHGYHGAFILEDILHLISVKDIENVDEFEFWDFTVRKSESEKLYVYYRQYDDTRACKLYFCFNRNSTDYCDECIINVE